MNVAITKPLPEILGQNMVRFRLARNLTVKECATLADVVLDTWYKWENGERWPQHEAMATIARVLRVEPDALLEKPEKSS